MRKRLEKPKRIEEMTFKAEGREIKQSEVIAKGIEKAAEKLKK